MFADPPPSTQLRISIICSDHISMYHKGHETLDFVLHNSIYRHDFYIFFSQLHKFPIRHVKAKFCCKNAPLTSYWTKCLNIESE